MAAPMELFVWKGDWGLPSVDTDCLTVLTYARFSGAPLKIHKLSNPWRSPSGQLPALRTPDQDVIFQPSKIITHLRKQKYNADYDLSATQGADTLAFMSLLEEKLLPAMIHSFWVDAKNYVDRTRTWYAETLPFPLNFFIPNQMHRRHLQRLQLLRGEGWREDDELLDKQLYTDAQECLNLLSRRLGTQKFFFGESPASLDAYVFSHLAPILSISLPNNRLQQHLRGLSNLSQYCSSILSLYFPSETPPRSTNPRTPPPGGEAPDLEEEPHKRRNQILSVAFGLMAMVGYALLSGIISIQRGQHRGALEDGIAMEEDNEEEE